MIGPILVKMIEHGEEADGLFYLYKTDMSEGVASKDYVDGKEIDSVYRLKIVRGACFESFEAVMEYIDSVNKKEVDMGYPFTEHSYQVEYYPYRAETAVGELLDI